jgi:hypothetical protein
MRHAGLSRIATGICVAFVGIIASLVFVETVMIEFHAEGLFVCGDTLR